MLAIATQQPSSTLTDTLFLNYPDFKVGVRIGHLANYDTEEYPERLKDEPRLMQVVTDELNAQSYHRGCRHLKQRGYDPYSYLYSIGFVLGYVEDEVLQPSTVFWEGVEEGRGAFKEGFFFPEDDKIWSAKDVVRHVSFELDIQTFQRDMRYAKLHHQSKPSYLHLLGFTIGYIDQALTRGMAS